MKILIAETDLNFAINAQLSLQEAGCQVVVVDDSISAWDLIQSDRPDLLITRITFGTGKVPGTALGARAYADRIRVIYVPLDVADAVHAADEHGAVLIKPVKMEELVDTAQRLLLGSHARVAESCV